MKEEVSMRAGVYGVQLRVCVRSHESVCKQYRQAVRDVLTFSAVPLFCINFVWMN